MPINHHRVRIAEGEQLDLDIEWRGLNDAPLALPDTKARVIKDGTDVTERFLFGNPRINGTVITFGRLQTTKGDAGTLHIIAEAKVGDVLERHNIQIDIY